MSSDRPIIVLCISSRSDQRAQAQLGNALHRLQTNLKSAKAPKESKPYRWAICESNRPADIHQAILDHQPSILQLYGDDASFGDLRHEHPTAPTSSTWLDQIVSGLNQSTAEPVRGVVLLACGLEAAATAIAERVPLVIAMESSFQEERAIAFLVQFYQALAANFSEETAYKLGCAGLKLRYGIDQPPPVVYGDRPQPVAPVNPMSWSLIVRSPSADAPLPHPDDIITYLRQLLADPDLTLQTIGIGSLKINLEGEATSFEMLQWLLHTGQIKTICGYPLHTVQGTVQGIIAPAPPDVTKPNAQLKELGQSLTGILPGTLPPIDVQELPTPMQALAREWRSQFQQDYLQESFKNREAIFHWLIGREPERFCYFSEAQLALTIQAIRDRYSTLKRYLGMSPASAQEQLVQTLCLALPFSLTVGEECIDLGDRLGWLTVVQAFIRKLKRRDSHIHYQTTWIDLCTPDPNLREILLLATLEDYCLRTNKLEAWLSGYLKREKDKG